LNIYNHPSSTSLESPPAASEKVTILLVLSADMEVPLIYGVCEKTIFNSIKTVKISLFKNKLSTKINYLITLRKTND
tara:strand:+ start:269 stop:499 length:231 start_codon:yes stop_codon:yes gene_type:complete